MFVNQYLVVKFLGRGACGKVFLCLNTHDLRLYAMKVRGYRGLCEVFGSTWLSLQTCSTD